LNEHGSPVAIVKRFVQGTYARAVHDGPPGFAPWHCSIRLSHHHGKADRYRVASPCHPMARRVRVQPTQIGDSVSTTTAIAILGRTALLAVLAALAACATRPAPEYGGRWKAVNRYAESPQEIPLHRGYVFHPSPMDQTLKAMLERWARDSKSKLSYLHPSDFTLHTAVAGIRTGSLEEAVMQLSAAYAQQGVSVSAEGGQITVRAEAPPATPDDISTAAGS